MGSPGGVGTVGAKGGAWREQAPLNSHIKSPYTDKMRRKSVPEVFFAICIGSVLVPAHTRRYYLAPAPRAARAGVHGPIPREISPQNPEHQRIP